MVLGAPVPHDDEQRLRVLVGLGVLDTAPEATFDRFVRLAAQLTGSPIACLTFVDRDRQWTKAAVGFAPGDVERRHAFCAHAILGAGVMEVEDAAADARFDAHPWVAGTPGVRFYAGAPLTFDRGRSVGTLCVLDTRVRPPLDPDARAALVDLAALCVVALEARQQSLALAFARDEVERLTLHDGATGAMNRRGLTDRLRLALALAQRTGSTVTATLIDLDDFAAVNERHGDRVGDEVLRSVARRLRDAVRETDLVGRVGADEFAVVLQATDEASAVVVAARLLAELGRPYEVAGATIELRASAGVATFPRDAEDLAGLLRAAGVALARAQRAGGGALAYVPDPT